MYNRTLAKYPSFISADMIGSRKTKQGAIVKSESESESKVKVSLADLSKDVLRRCPKCLQGVLKPGLWSTKGKTVIESWFCDECKTAFRKQYRWEAWDEEDRKYETVYPFDPPLPDL